MAADVWDMLTDAPAINVTASGGGRLRRAAAEVAAPSGACRICRPVEGCSWDELAILPGRIGQSARLGRVMVQAVHGTGGIGKNTLAARWAASYPSEHGVTG